MGACYDFDIVCIGSGPAGQSAAIQAAKLGKRVAIVEKRSCVGGVCLEVGTIPSKTFREAVWSHISRTGHVERGSAFRFKAERTHRPSVEELLHRVGMVGQRESLVIEQQLCRNEVELIQGEAAFTDPHTLTITSTEGHPYETGIARYREIARGHILSDDSGFLKLLFHREDHRLLGVHAVGTGATELIHIGQAVLELGGGLRYFLRTVFNYPTLAECYKVAALNAFNKLSTERTGVFQDGKESR